MIRKIAYAALIIATLAGCCPEHSEPKKEKPIITNCFDSVPMWCKTGMGLVSGDFDGDGCLDFIIGAGEYDDVGKLYFLRNNNGDGFAKATNFARVPMWYETGMGLTAGDYDNDGDLDLIVGAGEYDDIGRMYHFKNDGKANFTCE